MVAWMRNGATTDIFANRVDRAGAVIWGANGVAVGAVPAIRRPAITGPSGPSTCFVSWSDGLGPEPHRHLCERLVNGVPSWAANGLPVCNAAGDQLDPVMVTATVGAIVVWRTVATRATGTSLASALTTTAPRNGRANGLPVCDVDGNQFRARMVSDQQGERSSLGWINAGVTSTFSPSTSIPTAAASSRLPDLPSARLSTTRMSPS